jgi:RNA polymerase sigma-70 factor (ECF subfamily)
LLDSGYRYALALCQDDHLAADLVQDAWLAVHKAGKPAPTMGYWLRSVRSRFLDHCRRGPRLVPTFNEDVDRSNEQSTNETQQEPLIAPERLTAALAHLRQEEREAIQLMVIEEMSASAAASVVGKSRGTIMSLVKRGIG